MQTKHKIAWVGSLICFYIYISSFFVNKLVLNVGIVFLMAFFSYKGMQKSDKHLKPVYWAFGVVLEMIFILDFYVRWLPSSKVQALANLVHLKLWMVILGGGGILALLSLPFLYFFFVELQAIGVERVTPLSDEENGDADKRGVIICLVTAITVITVCSTSSFLYPYNDNVDANVYMTVGKAMMNGMVPYRDIYDQKGILIHFIHGLAWCISNTTFHGMYLFEMFGAFVFLLFCYKIMRLYCQKDCVVLIPFLAAAIYSPVAMLQGDTAESLCIPFIIYSVWVGLKHAKYKTVPTLCESLWIGITSGCIFWIKFSLTTLYLGWFLAILLMLLWDKKAKQVFAILGMILLGVAIVTIPCLVYFGVNHAFADLYEGYFYNNLFLYPKAETGGFFARMWTGFKSFREFNYAVYLLIGLGTVGLWVKKRFRELLLVVLMFVCSFVGIYISGRNYYYYSVILSVFAVIGMIFIYEVARESIVIKKMRAFRLDGVVSIVLGTVLALLFSMNRWSLGMDKMLLPHFRFDEIIRQKENPTLLNYGFTDIGFYQVSDIMPNCRAFCIINVPLDEFAEQQNYYVENGLCDFVVTRDETPEWDKYEIVEHCYYSDKDYYLYRLKE